MKFVLLGLVAVPGCCRHAEQPTCPPPEAQEDVGVINEFENGAQTEEADCRSFGIQTGDPIPPGMGTPAPSGQVRWLATDPRVPFAVIDEEGIHSPDVRACIDWALIGSVWIEVDRWGQPIGERRLIGGEGYDATQCYELSFDGDTSRGATLLLNGDYEAPPSVEWTPSALEMSSLVDMVSRLDGLFPIYSGSGAPLPPVAERSMFFTRPQSSHDENSPTRWAVVGGRTLAVLSLHTGDWRIRHLENRLSVEGFGPASPYDPVAVFDMDGDGEPEIVFHESEGVQWNDVILEQRGSIYERTIESISGATI